MITLRNGKRAIIAFACAIVLGFALPAQSQTWLIDFGDSVSYRGASVLNPDSNGNYWNSVHWDYIPSLIDIAGNSTSAAYGLDALGGTDSYNGPAGDTSAHPSTIGNTVFNPAALGNLGITNGVYDFFVDAKFQIQGLDPTKQYKLTFFGSHKFSTDDATRYSICSDGSYNTVLQSVDLNVQTPGSPWLHNEDTVAVINGVSPQLDTIMYIKFAGAGGSLGYLNAMQLEVIPEPTTIVLVGLGMLSLVTLRRRHTS